MHESFVTRKYAQVERTQRLCPPLHSRGRAEQNVDDHFVGFHGMLKIGSGAERGFDDGIKLSWYAWW